MNEVDHAIVHVTRYLSISEVLRLCRTCTTLSRFDELWMHFMFYLKQRVSSSERIYMNKISYTFFCRCKPTCIAFCLYQKMQRIPKCEHLNCLSTRKNILLFLVASVLKNGRAKIGSPSLEAENSSVWVDMPKNSAPIPQVWQRSSQTPKRNLPPSIDCPSKPSLPKSTLVMGLVSTPACERETDESRLVVTSAGSSNSS